MSHNRPVWLGDDRRRFDHIRVHIDLVRDKHLGAADKGLYSILAMLAETTSGVTVEVSQAELEELSGLNHTALWRSLKRMEDLDYLGVIRAPGRGHHNRYRLLPMPDKRSRGETFYGDKHRVKHRESGDLSFKSIETNQEVLFDNHNHAQNGAESEGQKRLVSAATLEVIRSMTRSLRGQ